MLSDVAKYYTDVGSFSEKQLFLQRRQILRRAANNFDETPVGRRTRGTTNGRNADWRDATQSAHVTDSSDGPPLSRDDFFFPSPLQIREGLTIPTMSIIPRNQPIAALLVHRVGAGRGRSVKQGNRIWEFVFLTSAHLTTREGARRDTARLLTVVIKIPKPTLEALCCQKGRGLNHT